MATREASIAAEYFETPIPAPDHIVIHQFDDNYNEGLAEQVEKVLQDGKNYWIMRCFTRDHASSSKSRLKSGMYGDGIGSGYEEQPDGSFLVAIRRDAK